MADPAAASAFLSGREAWHGFQEAASSGLERESIDLSGLDLQSRVFDGYEIIDVDLRGCNASEARFYDCYLRSVDGRKSNFDGSHWAATQIRDVSLKHCTLSRCSFDNLLVKRSWFTNALLSSAEFRRTTFLRCAFDSAAFRYASLLDTNFIDSTLAGADFSGASLAQIRWANIDLSEVIGLATTRHFGPSSVGIDTIVRSLGKAPEIFLQGCGVPDEVIAYLPSLVGSVMAINYRSCFISYGSQDDAFARRLHSRLQSERVRVWFAPEDMKGGEKLRDQVDRAIELHDRLIVVLSEHSMASEWVVHEIRRARRQEVREKRRKLFPIRLVDWETLQRWEAYDSASSPDLAEEVRQYYVPDFSNWKHEDAFEREFAKLLRDLRSAEDPPSNLREGEASLP